MPITRTIMVDDDGSGSTGTILNNAWLQTIYNQIDALFTLTTYTPTWRSSAGAAPSLGNGTLTGKYLLLGDLVWANLTLTIGSTTTLGGGSWIFSLPPGHPFPATGKNVQGGGLAFINFGYALAGAFNVGTTEYNPFTGPVGSAGVPMDATHPAAWVAGAWLDYYVTYRRV